MSRSRNSSNQANSSIPNKLVFAHHSWCSISVRLLTPFYPQNYCGISLDWVSLGPWSGGWCRILWVVTKEKLPFLAGNLISSQPISVYHIARFWYHIAGVPFVQLIHNMPTEVISWIEKPRERSNIWCRTFALGWRSPDLYTSLRVRCRWVRVSTVGCCRVCIFRASRWRITFSFPSSIP